MSDRIPGSSADRDPLGSGRAGLTRAQQLIWAGMKLDFDEPLYNTAWRFDLHQVIDPDIFRQAFAQVAMRCDALRLVILEQEGMAFQQDLAQPAGLFETIEVGDSEEAARWIDSAVVRRFDLAVESYHSALIRVSGEHWIWYLNQHHIVNDASSGAILFKALAETYAALSSGARADETPLPSFVAHARAEADRINSADVDYWREQIARRLPLPRLYGRSTIDAGASAVMNTVPLGRERSAKLLELIQQDGFAAMSRQQGLFNVFLTLLVSWMHRVSNEKVLPVGIVTHGRGSLDARQTAGCFIELFPLVVDLPDGPTFRNLHQAAAEQSLDVLRHASPGTSSARAQSRFNVVLNIIPTRFDSFGEKFPRVEWLDNGCIDPHHAFRLNVMDFGDSEEISIALVFNRAVFDATLCARAESHLFKLLDALLENPDAPIDAVPLAVAEDAAFGLVDGSAELLPEPLEDLLDYAASHARNDPGAVAVIDDSGMITREQLLARAAGVSLVLKSHGVAPGDLVGIHLTRSAELVAALLGVLKLGAAFVPLDPGQPGARLDAVENEAELSCILTEKSLGDGWRGRAPTIEIDTITNGHEGLDRIDYAGRLAYVMFTSGSTGRPKGVCISRASLVRYARWASRSFAGPQPSAWALHSAIGFDLTITSIFAPLLTGGVIHVYRDRPGEPDLSITRVFNDDAVEVVKLTPAHLSLALETAKPTQRIRALVLGGEDLSTSLARRTREILGSHVRIFNEYGPTEATVGCMIHEFDPDLDTSASVPIGRPADDSFIYVLDDGLNPVPDHVKGELYIAGPDRLARGYLGQPAETAKKFLDDPFRPNQKMYRSGDLASVRGDGTILFHGRADEQVKIGGVRIEPGEIVQAALNHPQISACTVSLFDPASRPVERCRRCGIGNDHPEVYFVAEGLCSICDDFEKYRDDVDDYFGSLDDLRDIVQGAAPRRKAGYDCLMLLSGGKDSTYALSRVAELTPRILVATLDNGYISEEAKKNIRKVTDALGVEHRFLTTPAMNEIFVDSLKQHANVCNGCFKTIYTLGLRLARDEGIPLIVTGLSRGQLFETRLAPELFKSGQVTPAEIDATVLAARRAYHNVPDVAARCLNGDLFDDNRIFEEIQFVDFYRYCDVSVAEMYRHLEHNVGWSRPMDTGRSTNCLINDAGIYVHKMTRHFHNYALPYSWDVRLGHKSREQANEELDDDINETRVQDILKDIGFSIPVDDSGRSGTQLAAYYVSDAALAQSALRRHLLSLLPREMVPNMLVPVDEIPLTPNGKVDLRALPDPRSSIRTWETVSRPEELEQLSPTEKQLLLIWQRVLQKDNFGVQDNFYDIGGDSIAAIQIASQASEAGLTLYPNDIFRYQSVASLARSPNLAPGDAAPPAAARASLDAASKAKLAELFGKKPNG